MFLCLNWQYHLLAQALPSFALICLHHFCPLTSFLLGNFFLFEEEGIKRPLALIFSQSIFHLPGKLRREMIYSECRKCRKTIFLALPCSWRIEAPDLALMQGVKSFHALTIIFSYGVAPNLALQRTCHIKVPLTYLSLRKF